MASLLLLAVVAVAHEHDYNLKQIFSPNTAMKKTPYAEIPEVPSSYNGATVAARTIAVAMGCSEDASTAAIRGNTVFSSKPFAMSR